jgi:tetraacyldisaccharide 4'-kinase
MAAPGFFLSEIRNPKPEIIMRRWLENLEQFAIDVILERRHGPRAAFLRTLLYFHSLIYARLVQLRLFLYRKRVFRERTLGCLVISIGNLTVGGTGKTPIVEKFARALQIGGRRVAILSRGYKSVPKPVKREWRDRFRRRDPDPPRIVSDGKSLLLDSLTAGDEPYMLANNLKDVIVLVDKDRAKSGLYAIREMKADTLLLDDGLQYLHLKHRLDIVLIDRQAPFGNEFLLPRGTLREPPRNLRRASYVFITKSSGEPNDELIGRIRRYNRTAEIIECAHQPIHLQNVLTGERAPLERLRDTYIGSICGIAAPESFEGGLRKLGARIELAKRFIDHHRYTEAELQSFINRCVRRDVDMIVTTEKDAVRFPLLTKAEVPIYFLRVEIEILSGHESWEHCVARICQPQPMLSPERFFS